MAPYGPMDHVQCRGAMWSRGTPPSSPARSDSLGQCWPSFLQGFNAQNQRSHWDIANIYIYVLYIYTL